MSLQFVKQGQYSKNIGSRLYLVDESGDSYYMFKLKNKEFTFTVDVSELPCGLNGALYFVEMEADGGSHFPGMLSSSRIAPSTPSVIRPKQTLKWILGPLQHQHTTTTTRNLILISMCSMSCSKPIKILYIKMLQETVQDQHMVQDIVMPSVHMISSGSMERQIVRNGDQVTMMEMLVWDTMAPVALNWISGRLIPLGIIKILYRFS